VAHHHDHERTPVSRKLVIATVANGLFVVVELTFGFLSNSLALIGDALHNFTDALALMVALSAVLLARRPPTPERSFGFQRAGILAAFINAGALVAFTVFIFVEAWERFQAPELVDTGVMMAVAAVGVLLNGGVTLWLREEGRHDVNVRSAVVHMFADALASVGVIVAALLIRYTGQLYWDAMISVAIGVLILWSSWGILRETVNLLLEGTPRGIDPEAVTRDLAAEEGVDGVHHLHIWAIAPSRAALSCHVQLGDVTLSHASAVLRRISSMLARRYNIEHTTIQFEHVACPEDDPYCVLPEAVTAGGATAGKDSYR
jgi:cobalt-zinc-cadmium efflux system protein